MDHQLLQQRVAALTTAHLADACRRAQVPVRCASALVRAVVPGSRLAGRVSPARHAGSVTVFVLLFGPILLVLTPLVALVGWARWWVGAHTVAQAAVATILAVVITIGTFWLVRVPVELLRWVGMQGMHGMHLWVLTSAEGSAV
jgi:hypothetical protein